MIRFRLDIVFPGEPRMKFLTVLLSNTLPSIMRKASIEHAITLNKHIFPIFYIVAARVRCNKAKRAAVPTMHDPTGPRVDCYPR